MKFFIIAMSIFFLSQITRATDLKFCKGQYDNHQITVMQNGSDVETSIDDNELHHYREIGDTQSGKYKMSGKEKSTMVLHDITLADFMQKRSLATELVVMTILGRPEYQGEEDMIYSYASSFISSLKCE